MRADEVATEGALTPDLTRARLFHRPAVARSDSDVRVARP